MAERRRSQGDRMESVSQRAAATAELEQRINEIQVERAGSLHQDSSRRTLGAGSVDRMQEFHERRRSKHDEVQEFRNRSRDWYQRKSREPEAGTAVTHNAIKKKYQDAFRNLSLELKKKIRSVKEERDGDGLTTEPPSRATRTPLESEADPRDSSFR